MIVCRRLEGNIGKYYLLGLLTKQHWLLLVYNVLYHMVLTNTKTKTKTQEVIRRMYEYRLYIPFSSEQCSVNTYCPLEGKDKDKDKVPGAMCANCLGKQWIQGIQVFKHSGFTQWSFTGHLSLSESPADLYVSPLFI